MNKKLHLHLLVNETAGNGHAKKIMDQTALLLINSNLAFDIQKSTYAGQTIKLAQEYGNQDHQEGEVLVVIGGDGTLNEALNGIKRSLHPDTPLAYLPAGTGNDFALAAQLTADPHKLLSRLQKSLQPEQIDCGSFRFMNHNERQYYFANSFGIGFDAYVNHLSNISNLKKILNRLNQGKLVYGLNILAGLRKQQSFSVEISSGHHHWHYHHVFLVTTTNHPYLGGGIPLFPNAKITSHKLDTIIIEKFSWQKLIKLFINLLKDGSHVNDPQFHFVEAEKITVKTKKSEYAQVDGEEVKLDSYQLEFAIDQFNLLR